MGFRALKHVVFFVFVVSSVAIAEEKEMEQYNVLEAVSDTESYVEKGKAALAVRLNKKTGVISNLLYFVVSEVENKVKNCETVINPENLKKGASLGSSWGVDILTVRSQAFNPALLDPKIIELKVLKKVSLGWSGLTGEYHYLSLILARNQGTRKWELRKEDDSVVKSIKFETEGEKGVKRIFFGNAGICEVKKNGEYVCESMGQCSVVTGN